MRIKTLVVIIFIVLATAGIWYYKQSVPSPFYMKVISRPFIPMKGENGIPISIPGQRVVFLVVIEDTGGGYNYGEAVDISATVSGASVSVNNPTIKPGEVAEVNVIPNQMSANKLLTITINGNRSGFKQVESFDIEVIDSEDDLLEVASEMRDKFVSWLTSNHPEFGVSNETEWNGTIVNPGILVVMHYMFFSKDWEMYVTWHVTTPPYDWTKIYLRPRFTETQSTIAFEISSVQGAEEPRLIALPDWI